MSSRRRCSASGRSAPRPLPQRARRRHPQRPRAGPARPPRPPREPPLRRRPAAAAHAAAAARRRRRRAAPRHRPAPACAHGVGRLRRGLAGGPGRRLALRPAARPAGAGAAAPPPFVARHHLIAFAGAALSPTPPPPPFVGRSPVWLSPSSITCGGARFGGCRAQLCTAELDLVVLELSWSNCELAPVGEMASTICFASAQSHVDAGKAIGTAHI